MRGLDQSASEISGGRRSRHAEESLHSFSVLLEGPSTGRPPCSSQDLRPNAMKGTMKMAAISERGLLLLLCCSVLSSAAAQSGCDSHAATGKNVVVDLNHPLIDTDRLKWRRDNTLILDRKPVGSGAAVRFSEGSKEDIFPNGSLILKSVKKTDAGVYTPEVFNKDGLAVPNTNSVRLCVLDPVPQPTLKTECKAPHASLTCQVGWVNDLSFEWFQNNKVMRNEKGQTLKRNIKDVKKDSFGCKVSNKISSRTSETVAHPCHRFSIIDIFWDNSWIFLGGGAGLVLLLTIVVIVCCVWAKRKKRMQKINEEELRLRWTNPEQQQQHQCPQHGCPPSRHHQHQHQHQHQRSAGHTGPRQPRSKQQREHQQFPNAPGPLAANPQPVPRRPAQTTRADVNGDDEQPPPLPQPRKKASRAGV